jgi:hypothetical protein
MNFQSIQAKQKQKKFPQNLIKSWDVTEEIQQNNYSHHHNHQK